MASREPRQVCCSAAADHRHGNVSVADEALRHDAVTVGRLAAGIAGRPTADLDATNFLALNNAAQFAGGLAISRLAALRTIYAAKANPFASIPAKGDVITASLGYLETGVLPFGQFVADDPEVHCLPYKLSVNGKGTNMRKTPKQHGAKHWDDKTVKDIVSDIAKDHGWTAKVSGAVGDYKYTWFGQEDESGVHVIERLARKHGALFTVKNGILIFADKGSGQSAGGSALTAVKATPDNIVDLQRLVSAVDSSRENQPFIRAATVRHRLLHATTALM